ncbi:MAG: hypothetical protein HN368_06900 [Spirochaetales bacterium]|nr:hypothetical protein [Spirochaetales bacterium]
MIRNFLFILCILLALTACDSGRYYLVGDRGQRSELKDLFTQLEKDGSTPESRIIINNQIINAYNDNDEYQKMNMHLTTYVKNHPDDKYNAYYILIVAENYRQAGSFPFAVHYFERVLKNYHDLLLEGIRSIHYICLDNLVNLVDEPEIRVNYYKELLERFEKNIDKGVTYYYLAEAYEELGKWDLAMQHYKEFLKYPETVISTRPNAWDEILSMVKFYDLPRKNWTMASLDELVDRIRNAIYRKDIRRLNDLRSGVNFFVTAWEEEEAELEITLLDDLGIFFNQSKTVRSSNTVDRGSNEKEALLRTTGWGHRIGIWYFSLRMVDFPPDPDIHGDWEWAGIYLGEKPY